MTQYNPDEVQASKIVHTETFSEDTITYGSLRDQAGRAAWGLQKKLGLQPGDTLLALVNNSNAFVLLAHATWWAGAIFAPLNTAATRDDISHILKITKPTHVATIEEKLGTVQDALASLPMTNTKILTVRCKKENLPQFPDDIIGRRPTESIKPYDLQGRSSKDVPSTICFSSGTTGKMKGVQLSHYNLITNTITMRVSMPTRVNSNVREVFFAPSVVSGMWAGAQYTALPAFDLETFCQKSSEMKVTDLHIVPPVALLLATSPVAQKYDLASLERIVISAAPLKKAVQLLLKKRLPHTSICQGEHHLPPKQGYFANIRTKGYGLTECTGGVIHQIDEEEHAFGCVGKLFAGVEARLVDPKTNKDVSLGKEGELWIRGPINMMGYVGDSEATQKTFSEGWIRTGDILKMDENQNFWVTDRLKEMIKYKGFQIAPSELEDMLLRHPDVIDAANVLDAIRAWMDNQLAGYKKLRGGVFHLQSLPKTPTGKILRRLLPAKLNELREAKL
ncbi:amp dependent CoA ligase [Penicillium macrosclerotiorum]|uniref:amp dependent CoA ligase n=1 Tax=Penicillium macrosclerotiorum TaxID=303699 RepID=UPI00254727BD|nr:amp dependent CoA ligase [Penicillium macrosclerotiorum]KAJ5679594.1 amp dependent CoA ligase [Penicillium macrosclerotiorum]